MSTLQNHVHTARYSPPKEDKAHNQDLEEQAKQVNRDWADKKETERLRGVITDNLIDNLKRTNPKVHKKFKALQDAEGYLKEVNHEIHRIDFSLKYEKDEKRKKGLNADLSDLKKQKTKYESKYETLAGDDSLSDILSDIKKVQSASLGELQETEGKSKSKGEGKDKEKATESAKIEFKTYKEEHPATKKTWKDFLPTWLGGTKKEAALTRGALIRVAAQMPKGNHHRRTILAMLNERDFAETIAHIGALTEDNEHTKATLALAGLLNLRKEWRVLVALLKIHEELGYMPEELITFRDSVLRDMLGVAKTKLTPAQYASLAAQF